MQSINKVERKTRSKDDLVSNKQEETPKRSVHSIQTPRYVQKTTTADIYVKKNATQSTKALKKTPSFTKETRNEKIKDNLKSSSSQFSVRSNRTSVSEKNQKITSVLKSNSTSKSNAVSKSNVLNSKVVPKSKTVHKIEKPLPINVTVSSPVVKRKSLENFDKRDESPSVNKKKTSKTNDVRIEQRQRTKTRTLNEEEVKVLTPEIDNNKEMINLTKLTAKPKAFYVDFDKDSRGLKHNSKTIKQLEQIDKSSEEEVSYEDDFESYESDFESYKSSPSESPCGTPMDSDETNNEEDQHSKEENMMDSGNFDLRDSRSAHKAKLMDFIVETSEEADKKVSLTDEGFQEMSSSSGAPSIKTVHVDTLERPLFIDFSKSKENRRKRRIFERLKRRAHDVLSMVTLHEMSYSLYEMKPIPYDLYMATFGRSNYIQTSVQTFDDGVDNDTQTDDILCDNKWTQHPIKFSKNVFSNSDKEDIKNEFANLNFLYEDKQEIEDEDYKNNNLRIYLEQRDGVGSDKMLSYGTYMSKLKQNSFEIKKLGKFLKKVERKVCNILSINAGNTHLSNLVKTSKFSFSSGYLSMSTRNLCDKYSYIQKSDIIGVVFSKSKSNLMFTIHRKVLNGIVAHKCILCLWDLSVAMLEPSKVLIATDNVKFGIFCGATDGFFIGALEDGSIQLWDLSEESTWCTDLANKSESVGDVTLENLNPTEKDREWNLKHRNVGYVTDMNIATLQASSYTTSAAIVNNNEPVDAVVALEYLGESQTVIDNNKRKTVGQICSLQRLGILTIWCILQEKKYEHDPGKAFWSKLKLEKTQTINSTDHIFERSVKNFNLNAAKKRLASKRLERNNFKMEHNLNKDRPKSASVKNSKILVENFSNCVVYCNDLKIFKLKCVNFLIAKNYGEILCCTKMGGSVKVTSLSVSNASSSVTSIVLSPQGEPYFLASTDCGTIRMCSLNTFRVLLTLDIRNVPSPTNEKCLSDHKGRFVGSLEISKKGATTSVISSLVWSPTDPLTILCLTGDGSLVTWDLSHSDIQARSVYVNAASACVVRDKALALVTMENEVHVHKLSETVAHLGLFNKYVSLL